MILIITDTTDGRYIGVEFDPDLPIKLDKEITFISDYPPQVLGNGYTRFYNSNYAIETKIKE